MGFDLFVFIYAGMQDALSPIPLATLGVLFLMMLFLRQARKWTLFIASVLFLTVVFFIGGVFTLGIVDLLVPAFDFFNEFKWAFLVIGAGFLFTGLLFLREWWRMTVMGMASPRFAAFLPTPLVGKLAGAWISLILAGALSVLASVWPANSLIQIQGGFAVTPGRLNHSLFALLVYEVTRNTGLFLVPLFFYLLRRKQNAEFLIQRRSLLSIIVSAGYFSVGGFLVFIFYVALTKPWF